MNQENTQFTVENASGDEKYFVLSSAGCELEDFKEWCAKHGVVFRESTQEEIDWFNDPEFKMDGDDTDEPCFYLPEDAGELMMSIKDW